MFEKGWAESTNVPFPLLPRYLHTLSVPAVLPWRGEFRSLQELRSVQWEEAGRSCGPQAVSGHRVCNQAWSWACAHRTWVGALSRAEHGIQSLGTSFSYADPLHLCQVPLLACFPLSPPLPVMFFQKPKLQFHSPASFYWYLLVCTVLYQKRSFLCWFYWLSWFSSLISSKTKIADVCILPPQVCHAPWLGNFKFKKKGWTQTRSLAAVVSEHFKNKGPQP